MAKYVGIDPGSKGSLCCLDTDDLTTVHFMDTPHDSISCTRVRKWLLDWNPTMIGVENVHSIHLVSAKSNFVFGQNFGIIKGVVGTTMLGTDLVQPKAWQKACGITFKPKSAPAEKKRIVAATAQQLYPSAALHGPRGGLLDGRSDALMIAHHIMIKYGGQSG